MFFPVHNFRRDGFRGWDQRFSIYDAHAIAFGGQHDGRNQLFTNLQIPTGGSIKGTSLEHATYGLRVLSSVRLTASQLTAAQVAIKRKIKPVKGAECFMRVFPDVPVCVKGNETRMGKGKGGFEYWACRVPVGRVVFEVGGGGIREEIARQGTYIHSDPEVLGFMASQTRSVAASVTIRSVVE